MIPVSISIPISIALMPAGGSVPALLLPSTALAVCVIYISRGSAQARTLPVSKVLMDEQGLIAYRQPVAICSRLHVKVLCAISQPDKHSAGCLQASVAVTWCFWVETVQAGRL